MTLNGDGPALLTVPEVATVLRVGRDTAYKLVNEGTIPSVRLGRSLRVPRDALIAHIESMANAKMRA